MSETITRAGMVTKVRVREYQGEPKFLFVELKLPTELPIAEYSYGTDAKTVHTDIIEIAVPLHYQIRVGDLVGLFAQVDSPKTESARFRPALEAGGEENGVEVLGDDVLEVNVEDGMIEEEDDES